MNALDLVMMKRFGGGSGGGGSGGGALVVNVTVAEEVSTCDKTAGEIDAAFPLVVFLKTDEVGASAEWVVNYSYDPDYGYYISTPSAEYTAATENDYPTSSGGPK